MTTAYLEPTLQDLSDGPGILTEADDGKFMQWAAGLGHFVMVAPPRSQVIMAGGGGGGSTGNAQAPHNHNGVYALVGHTHNLVDLTDVDITPGAGVDGYSIIYDNASGKFVLADVTGGGGYSNEQAQDAVGTILTDSDTIAFAYDDATPAITADVKDGSITAAHLADSYALVGHTHEVDQRADIFNDVEGDPANVAGAAEDGTSTYAARRDHVHTIGSGVVTSTMLQDGAALAEILDDDGAGSGLDADLLDGHDSTYFLAASAYTAADVLAKLLTVDGASSGLDADLLDGLSSAAFAAASHVHAGEDITSGTVADARIASTITRDSEVFGIVLANDGNGSGLDADLLRGTTPTAFGLSLIDDAAASNARTTLGLVIGTDVQAFDATLLSLATLGTAADKIAYTTAVDTWAETALTSFGRSLIDDADASAGRTTLGLVIGTNVQAYDAELAALAGLTSAADKLPYFTGSGTAAIADFTAAGRALVDDADATAQRATLGLVIGTNVQAFDAELAAIAGLTSAADKLPYFTGSGTAALADITTFGRSLIDDAAASNARTTLGLGTMAVEAEAAYALLAGRSGGQILKGGTASGDGLQLESTNNATKGAVILQPNGGNVGIATTTVPLSSAWGSTPVVTVSGTVQAVLELAGNRTSGASGVGIIGFLNEGIGGADDRIGQMDCIRDGADNSGAFRILTWNAGSAGVRMLVDHTGQVGIGTTSPGGILSVKAGTSSDFANVGGVIDVSTAQTGNVGTGEDDLASFSVPANTLAVNGQSVWFEASGTFTTGNNKTVRVRFGTSGTNLIFTSNVTNYTGSWTLWGRVIRTGDATQKAYVNFRGQEGLVTNLNQTLSGAVTLKITGEATANNDVVCEAFTVGYDDNNT